MLSKDNRKRKMSSNAQTIEDVEGSEEVPKNTSSANMKSPPASGDSCFLEAGPSKAFTESTLQTSTSSRGGTPQSGRKKKISIRKLSIEAALDIPLNDDCNELIQEEEKSIAEQEKALNKSLHKTEDEPDVSIVTTMTKEQIQEHVSRCLQLSTENKINTKNAFALKLIECMTIITKNEDKTNFAAMACQLDAGAKIYSSRVDAVHQQVMKLAETCTFANKKKKERDGDNENEDEEENEAESGKDKEKRKKPRKKVITTNDQISRQLMEDNPRDMFVRLEALPGDIINKAKYSSDLSLTLEKNQPFWVDFQKYKPIRSEGENWIPEIEIKSRKLRPRGKTDEEIDISSLSLVEPSTSGLNLKKEAEEGMDADDECDNSDNDYENMAVGNVPEDDYESSVEASKEDCTDFLSLTRSKLTNELSKKVSPEEVIKTMLHEPGESDYHYLKMDNCNFWAGPSHWKRPQGKNLAENKKKPVRKKKDPAEVQYEGKDADREMKAQTTAAKTSKNKVKAPTLSKRALAKWSKKKVTFPQDIHFEPEKLYMLHTMDIVAEVVHEDAEELDKEKRDEETQSSGEDDEMSGHAGACSPDMFANSSDETSTGFRGFPSSVGSDKESENEFRGFPSSRSTSPFSPAHGFRGFDSQAVSSQDTEPSSNPSPEENDNQALNSTSCDAYEGNNLVPMVKRVTVDPIRIVAKPNRVDMQHLKCVMLNIIRRSIEDRENQLRDEGLLSPRGSVMFRDVLMQLFSSDKLHQRTKEDLTVQMAFLCVLTLINENNFHVTKDESDDFLIMNDDLQF